MLGREPQHVRQVGAEAPSCKPDPEPVGVERKPGPEPFERLGQLEAVAMLRALVQHAREDPLDRVVVGEEVGGGIEGRAKRHHVRDGGREREGVEPSVAMLGDEGVEAVGHAQAVGRQWPTVSRSGSAMAAAAAWTSGARTAEIRER